MPKPNLPRRAAATFSALTLLLATMGCATAYEVKVNSIRRPGQVQREVTSYRIQSRIEPDAAQKLRVQEAVQHIKTALSAKGLYEAPTADAADMIVEMDYSVTAVMRKKEEYQELVFNPPDEARLARGDSFQDRPTLEFENAERTLLVREKQLSICGRVNQRRSDDRPPEELWRVYVSIEDESRDLRRYLPLLASVAMDQIGRNTGGETTTLLRADAEAVRFIEKGM